MKYLVIGSEGPGFNSPEEAVDVLENGILPTFEMLMKFEKNKTILAGGLPVGERTFVFIAEALSNDELDLMLRQLPVWGSMKWQVTPMQSFSGRAAQEQEILEALKVPA